VDYGQGARKRNLLDIYLPLGVENNETAGTPVVIFLTGGAWIIGYKLWGTFIGRGLAYVGILTIIPDYRNFPQGDIENMVHDVNAAIRWTSTNADKYKGDPNKIVLAGQSAGAHICMCALIDALRTKMRLKEMTPQVEADRQTSRDGNDIYIKKNDGYVSPLPAEQLVIDDDGASGDSDTWREAHSPLKESLHRKEEDKDLTSNLEERFQPLPLDLDIIKLYIGISGPYNLQSLSTHVQGRGLDHSILEWICRGDLRRYSPSLQLEELLTATSSSTDTVSSDHGVNNAKNGTVVTAIKSLFPASLFPLSPSSPSISVSETKGLIKEPTLNDWGFPAVALFHGMGIESFNN
jgi:alpha/beta superfamily hydrolase